MNIDRVNDGDYHPSVYELSPNHTKVTKKTFWSYSAYFSNRAYSGIHQWHFKILKCSSDTSNYMVIGIWKANHKIVKDGANLFFFHDQTQKDKGCGWDIRGKKIYSHKSHDWESYGDRGCNEGDTVTMILNMNHKELRYKINGKDQGVAFKDLEDTEYRAAVCFLCSDQSIECVQYEHDGNMNKNDDDIKCNLCDTKTQKIDSLKKEIKSLQIEINENKTHKESDKQKYETQRQQIIDLKDEYKKQITLLKSEYDSLKNETSTIKKEKNEKSAENDELKAKILRYQQMEQTYDEMNTSNIGLNEDYKELEMNFEELNTKYIRLLNKTKLNENKYMEWDHDIVCEWIISLNHDYKRYENVLQNSLKEEEVSGKVLSKLDKNDLHRFGIKAISHKIDIMEHIKRITSTFNHNNEGNATAEPVYIAH